MPILDADGRPIRRGNTFMETPCWLIEHVSRVKRQNNEALRQFTNPVVITDDRGNIVERAHGAQVGDVVRVLLPRRYT